MINFKWFQMMERTCVLPLEQRDAGESIHRGKVPRVLLRGVASSLPHPLQLSVHLFSNIRLSIFRFSHPSIYFRMSVYLWTAGKSIHLGKVPQVLLCGVASSLHTIGS